MIFSISVQVKELRQPAKPNALSQKRTQQVNKHNTTLYDRKHKRRSGIKLKISTSVSPDKTDALSLHCLLIQERSFTTQYYKSCESRPLARFLISIIFMFCTFASFHLCEPPQTCLPRHEVSTFFFQISMSFYKSLSTDTL